MAHETETCACGCGREGALRITGSDGPKTWSDTGCWARAWVERVSLMDRVTSDESVAGSES